MNHIGRHTPLKCSNSEAPVRATNSAAQPYLFVGIFEVTVTQNGQARTIRFLDGLGVYDDAGFERHKAAEIASRESLIRAQFGEQDIAVGRVILHHVEKVPVPEAVVKQQGTLPGQ